MKLPKKLTPTLDSASVIPFSETQDVLTDKERTQFLDLVAQGATQHRAASKIGVPFWVVGATRRTDERFDAAVVMAIEIRDAVIGDMLEETLINQAIEGVEEGVYHQGFQVDTVRKFGTNGNAQFLLRGLKREKYGTERSEQKLDVQQHEPPPAVRNDNDAKRLLARMKQELLPVIEGTFREVTNDGSDLI